MYRFSYTIVATHVFFITIHAQASLGCDEISPYLNCDAFAARYTMTAPRINGSHDEAVDNNVSLYAVNESTSNSWTLTLRLKAQGEDRDTETTMFLNMGDSDLINMGACIYIMHADRGDIEDGYRWTQQTLKSSPQDNGDCKAMLGEGCVEALREKHANRASFWHMDLGWCSPYADAGLNNGKQYHLQMHARRCTVCLRSVSDSCVTCTT